MDNTEITNRVLNVIAEQTGFAIAEVTPQSHIVHDLSADSLDGIEIVMMLEEEFDIEITDEEAEQLHTVAQAIELVSSKVGAGVRS
jgi:acyl carrier protein